MDARRTSIAAVGLLVALARPAAAFAAGPSPAALSDASEDHASAKSARDDAMPAVRAAEAPRIPRFREAPEQLRVPRPAPFVLPDLAHRGLSLGALWTIGSISPEDATRSHSAVALVRLRAETNAGPLQSVYLGLTYPFGAALPPDGSSGTRFVPGNLEAHVRVVFPLPSSVAFGTLFAVTVPTAAFTALAPSGNAGLAAASLEPTDALHFLPNAVALRPAFDLRLRRGPLVVQAREGLDLVLRSASPEGATTMGRILAHAGILVAREVEISLEATQTYFFDQSVPDGSRTHITLGPGARFSTRGVDVGLGLVTNLFSPLAPGADQFVALRLALDFELRSPFASRTAEATRR